MDCVIKDVTKSEIVDALMLGINPKLIQSAKTQDDSKHLLKLYGNLVKTELVDNSKLKKGLHLDKDKTSRYVWLDSGEVAFNYRTTDASKAKFKKRTISNPDLDDTPDSIILREVGTRLHSVAEKLMQTLVSTINHENVRYDKDLHKTYDLKTLQSEAELDDIDWRNFEAGIRTIFHQIIEKQKQIDPKGKVDIYTERIVFDKLKDMAGTIDLLAVYSDNTGSIFDYKAISPDAKTVDYVTGMLKDFNWIGEHRLDSYYSQLPKLKEMLKTSTNIKEVRSLRIVPIQLQMKLKPKNTQVWDKEKKSVFTKRINRLNMDFNEQFNPSGVKSKYLRQVPIGKETTGIKGLDTALDELLLLRNNLLNRLNSNKYDKESIEYNRLKARIGKTSELISDIIINKDFKNIANEYAKLISTYLDTTENKDYPFDIDDPKSNKYVSSEDIKDLIDDITIFKNIINTAPQYYKEAGVKVSAEEMKEINDIRVIFSSKADMLENYLKEKYKQRYLSEDDINALESNVDKKLGWWDKLFGRLSGIQNTLFQKLYSTLSKQNDKTRLQMRTFTDNLRKRQLAVEAWGNQNGKTGLDVYDVFINKSTGNLHSVHSKELYNKIEEAQKKNDVEYLKSVLKLKSDADVIFNNESIKFMRNAKVDDKSEAYLNWAKLNNPKSPSFDKITDSTTYRKYYEIDDNKLKNEDFNSNYLIIKNNKALLDFYNFWTDSMEEFRNLLNMGNQYQKIPNNFLPNIRQDLMERIIRDGIDLTGFKDSFKELFNVEELEQFEFQERGITIKGAVSPETGEFLREIPRYFINPLRVNGEINNTLKSYDLGKSIQMFASMAYNYANLNEVEANINAYKEILLAEGTRHTTTKGEALKYEYNTDDVKSRGAQTDEAKLFEEMVDYHLYGIRFKQVGKTERAMLQLKKYQQLKELGGSILGPLGNALGARSNAIFEAHKSYYYNRKQFANATKARGNNIKTYFALAHFFQPYQGKHYNSQPHKLSANKLIKNVNIDLAFALYRKGDEHIDEQILYAMLQNYGIENGKIVRIGSKTGIKSLLELTSVDDEGNLLIEGILDKNGTSNYDLYNQFRNTVINVVASVKGSMNEEDMNAVNFTVLSSMLMSFKNWMPAMVEERFRGLDSTFRPNSKSSLRYNTATETITEARWTAYFSNIEDTSSSAIINFIRKIVNPSVAKLLLEATTFGISPMSNYYLKVDEARARQLFEKFKEENKGNASIQNYSFDDFVEYKKGQFRALATEVRFMMAIIGLVMAMGADWDDDGKADYKKVWLNRQLFRIANRYRRELMSLVNPYDWINLTDRPIPIIGLSTEFLNFSGQVLDETLDATLGEAEKRSIINPLGKKVNSKKDKKDIVTEGSSLIPGYKMIQWLDVLSPEDKEKEY